MYKKQVFMIVVSCYLAGCAIDGNTDRTQLDSGERTGSDCISEGTIRNYEVLDDSNIVVSASAARKYHIALTRRAFNLQSSWNIGFTSPTSRICGRFSEIVVDDTFGPERIRIKSVRQITDEEYEDLRSLFDRDTERVEKPLSPEEVAGAEVDELD